MSAGRRGKISRLYTTVGLAKGGYSGILLHALLMMGTAPAPKQVRGLSKSGRKKLDKRKRPGGGGGKPKTNKKKRIVVLKSSAGVRE